MWDVQSCLNCVTFFFFLRKVKYFIGEIIFRNPGQPLINHQTTVRHNINNQRKSKWNNLKSVHTVFKLCTVLISTPNKWKGNTVSRRVVFSFAEGGCPCCEEMYCVLVLTYCKRENKSHSNKQDAVYR